MDDSRKRFLSIWNGVATIIFFAGIILGFSTLGYSGWILGIFMWIIGGTIAGMIYGPPKKRSRDRKARIAASDKGHINVQVENGSSDSQFCIACGTNYPINEQFCPQCGTASTGSNGDSLVEDPKN
ncbi:MAG: hypothetical protein ACW99A_03765 [Candidatus Kariarchaeaceae archaeon]